MKYFKQFLIMAVAVFATVFLNITALAQGITICYDGAEHIYTGSVYKLFVNDREISSPMEPIIFNDHALVPVREIFEELGAIVEYNGDSRAVKVRYGGQTITMHINNNCAYINGKPVKIPDNVVPKLIYKPGGLTKTMVPVRFISESVGMKVDFVGDKGEIRITAPTAEAVPTPTPTPMPTAAPTVKPTPTEKPTEKINIKSVTNEFVTSKKLKITVNCDASPKGKVSYFDLKNPERVVVDFKGIDCKLGASTDEFKSDIIKAVRIGVDNERTRIVVDVVNLGSYKVDIKDKVVTITVTVTGEKAPTSTATPKPSDKDYSQAGDSAVNSQYNKGIVKASAVDAKKVIMLDAGHGGTDPGALGKLNGKTVNEKDLTLSITYKVKAILDSNGYKTAMTRTGDTLPSLSERPQMANDKDCALFASIHINSAEDESASGTEVYYSEENNGDEFGLTSQEFATNVLDGMLKYMKSNDRGIRMANWAVIRRSNMPAVLIEVGFISNEKELKLMCSDDYQNKVARGIAEGIINTIHYVNVPR